MAPNAVKSYTSHLSETSSAIQTCEFNLSRLAAMQACVNPVTEAVNALATACDQVILCVSTPSALNTAAANTSLKKVRTIVAKLDADNDWKCNEAPKMYYDMIGRKTSTQNLEKLGLAKSNINIYLQNQKQIDENGENIPTRQEEKMKKSGNGFTANARALGISTLITGWQSSVQSAAKKSSWPMKQAIESINDVSQELGLITVPDFSPHIVSLAR
jgi:hypothetical protein